jgi:hypothetical protein
MNHRKWGGRAILTLLVGTVGMCSACGSATGPQTSPLPRADLSFAGAHPSTAQSCVAAEAHSDFQWIQDVILTPTCASQIACHQNATVAEHLDLRKGKAYDALLTTKSGQFPAMSFVVARDPENSYLLIKAGESAQMVGVSMPFGRSLLCVQQLQAIERWIAGGAAP